MINIDDKTRKLSQASIVIGYKQENKAESIEFEIPDYLKDFGKKICFKTKTGKVFSKLFDNTTSNIFTFTRTETQYGELDATIQFFKTENEDMIIYKTSMLHIIFSDAVNCEDEVSPDEPKIPILEELIEKVTELNETITKNETVRNDNENTRISNENERISNEKERKTYYTDIKTKVENGDFDGATFLPNVDTEGNVSWTNNKGLENPTPQNIKGPQGPQGIQGEAFKIKKTYASIEEMQADFDNMEVGDYVMITSSVEIEDNAKLYARAETEWVFITDFSGATGIQGEQGPQGIQGIQGERGIGISKLEVIDGSLWVTLTDSTTQNAGLIITDEVKQWIVNQVTENAKSKFNTYYDGKVSDFDNHATTKINEYNTNAENKINEYNQNAESLTNRITDCEEEDKRLRNDINSIAIVGEAEGESIDLDDSSDARFLEFEVGGNHKQETREGYNLIDTSAEKWQQGYYNYTNNTGDYVKSNTLRVCQKEKKFYDKQTTITAIIPENFSFRVDSWNQDGTYAGTVKNWYDASPQKTTFVIQANLYCAVTLASKNDRMNINPGELSKYEFLFYEGTEEKGYEPYGASPSIDYSSEVETVGSNVNFLENTATTQTINGVTFTVNKDGRVMVNGSATTSITFKINNNIVPKNISNLILSGCPNNGSNTTYDLKIELYKNSVWTKALYDFGNGVDTGDLSEYTSCTISITIRKDYTAKNLIFKPKLEKGKVATPYSPYGMGSVEIDVVNKNLYNGKTEIGGINNDGTLNNTTDRWRTIDYINVKNITNISINIYNITTTGPLGRCCFYDKNYNFLSSTQIINKNTIVNVSNVSYLKFWLLNDKVPSNAQIQVEADSIPTVCIQHQEQTVIMPVQQEKLKEDYFDFDREKEVHVMKKLVLKGTETIGRWTVVGNTGTEWRFAISAEGILRTSGPTEIANIICNKLKTTSAKNTYDKETGIAGEANSDVVIIYIEECKEMTVSEFNAYLKKQYDAGTPVIIYYKLATPIELDFTDEQKAVAKQIKETLHTYKNVTHILSNDEVSPIFNVKYAKDTELATKLYVDKTHYMYFPGYSPSKTQFLKNVNGTLTWVDE